MATLNPLATGVLEASALALLGIVLFQLRHRAGLVPFLFLLGVLAEALPFLAHASPLELADPWTVSRAHIVILPVLVGMVLLLHTVAGEQSGYLAALGPLVGGVLAAGAALMAGAWTVALPSMLLAPSPWEALATGVALALSIATAVYVFEWWHRNTAAGAPFSMLFVVSALTGILAHGLIVSILAAFGLEMVGVQWPGTVAVPVLAGAGPMLFIGLYAESLLEELAPLVVHRGAGPPTDDKKLPNLEAFRRAEERYRQVLRQGEDAASTYQDLLDTNPTPLLRCEGDGRIVFANSAAAELLDTTREALLDQDAAHLLFGPRGQRSLGPPRVEQGQVVERITLPTAGQRHRVLELRHRSLPSGGARVELADVSHEALQEAMATHRQQARFAVDLMVRELPNYLLAPRTSLESLEDRQGLDPEVQETLGRTRGALDDLDRLLRRLEVLGLTDRVVTRPLDLAEELSEAVADHQRSHEAPARVVWELGEDAPLVRGTPALQAAFEHLVENVADHAGPDPQVTVRARRERHGYVISFDDNGPGMPPERREAALGGTSSARHGRGRGLGLYLARRIVEACGGEVWITDRVAGEPSEGTSVRLWLPGASHGTPPATEVPAGAEAPTSNSADHGPVGPQAPAGAWADTASGGVAEA